MKDVQKWKLISSEYLFRRPWLTARRDHLQLPNGTDMPEYYVLEYPDWINIIALTRDGQMLLERQYRHGRQMVGWEDDRPRMCYGEYLPAHQAIRFSLTDAQPVDMEQQ